MCEQACSLGLSETRSQHSELPHSCLVGATAEEIVDLGPEVCDEVASFGLPWETWSPEQVVCVAEAVLTCAGVDDAVETCLYVPPPPPSPAFQPGDWRAFPTAQLEDSSCPVNLGMPLDLHLAGDGYTLEHVELDLGGDTYSGSCTGTHCGLWPVQTYTDFPYIDVYISFDSLTSLHGDVWLGTDELCNVVQIEGTWLP